MEDWLALANEAGVKHPVIKSKHCDGFATYPYNDTNKLNVFFQSGMQTTQGPRHLCLNSVYVNIEFC